MEPQTGPLQMDPLIGQTIGNYLVIQKLGEGGMGSVYLGEHPTIGKRVALKVLHPEFSTNPEVIERFFTEARAVNAIAHPNIVDIVDYGVIEDSELGARLVYITMEYLPGQTLTEVLRAEAPLAPERAFAITLQVASALAASHRCNIVHRDLKPDNIMLTARIGEPEAVKLLDFGIAKLTTEGQPSTRTRTGLVLGTPAYMSPEQCEGSSRVDQRADIYALGICLYEMLVGRVPFLGESYGEVLVQHLTQPPIAPSHYRLLPAHVEQVVMKALEKRPELRYPSMDEFRFALLDPMNYVETHGGLGEFLATEIWPSQVPPSPLSPPSLPLRSLQVPNPLLPSAYTTLSAAAVQVTPRRSRVGVVLGSMIAAAGLGAGLFWLLHERRQQVPRTEQMPDIVMSMSNSAEEDRSPSPSSAPAPTGPVAVEPVPTEPAPTEPAPSKSPSSDPSNAVEPGRASESPGRRASTSSPSMVTLQINSNPEGADIFINGQRIGDKTDAKLQYPRGKKSATITLRLKGYEDLVIPRFALNRAEITKSVTLKPIDSKPVNQSVDSNAWRPCDTCLERPD